VGPVKAGAGHEAHRAAIEARMHAVAVEFDFVQPLGPVGRLVDELGELRPYPLRQTGRVKNRRLGYPWMTRLRGATTPLPNFIVTCIVPLSKQRSFE